MMVEVKMKMKKARMNKSPLFNYKKEVDFSTSFSFENNYDMGISEQTLVRIESTHIPSCKTFLVQLVLELFQVSCVVLFH